MPSFSASDALRLAVSADTAGAVKEFDKLGKGIKSSLGDVDKQATGLKGTFGNAFEGLAAKSSTVSSALGKIGLSGQQAGAAIATALPAAGLAAGAALVAFAAKGVSAFQDVALAAGKFSDATGLNVETSSRYIAIADDIGVGAGTIQNAFLKMEKAMGANKAAFGDLIATTKSGGTDLSQTFLNAITHLQGIKDPIQRATEASKLFGKGFAEVGELINTDADKIKESLASVSDAQVIKPDELEKARKYRAAMDNLHDAVSDLAIDLGQGLVPSITAVTNGLAGLVNAADKVTGPLGGIGGAIDKITKLAPGVQFFSIFDKGASNVDRLGGAVGTFVPVLGNLIKGLDGSKSKTDDASAANAALAATLAQSSGQISKAQLATDRAATSQGTLSDQIARSAASFGTFEQRAAGMGHAIDASNASLEKQNNLLQDNIDQALAAAGSALGVSAAQRDFNKAVQEATEVQKDAKASSDDKAAAYDRETQAALDTAGATVTYAEKQAEAAGKTLSAKEKQDLLIGTLYQLAGQMNGPSKDAIIGMIQNLQSLGQQHPEPTATLNDQASTPLADLKGKVDGLDAARATISVGADTSSAKTSINAVIRGINSIIGWSGSGKKISEIATGTRDFGGGLALVGEKGPELVMLPPHAQVWNAQQTAGMFSHTPPAMPKAVATGGQGVVVNFNGTFLASKRDLGRMVDEALAEARRAGNRAA